jgi:hypothetical protein
MALVNNPNITQQIAALANTGTIDTNQIIALLNSALPAGQQIASGISAVSQGIYKRFGEFDKVNAKVEVVTTGIWSGGSGSLVNHYTSSTQIAQQSGQYYINVYNFDPETSTNAEVQYAIAYGHPDGSGSTVLSGDDNALLPTKATYKQYQSMLLDNPSNKFSFTNSSGVSTDANELYFINLNRARYREEMDAGNWKILLTGTNGTFQFIDDSGQKFGDDLGRAGRVFNVVSGALNIGTENDATIDARYDATNGLGYGAFYPDRGIIVLNAKAIGQTVGNITFTSGSTSVTQQLSGSLQTDNVKYNHVGLYEAIKAGQDFEARRTENVNTQHFFVRATNREFNYSNNPTYINTNGTFVETSFKTDPKTYITTIGLYNDSNELIAVAKTSQPIAKSFDKEVLIKVKLSF